MNPILVVGTGRCGTSVVARLLHEMGVYMGTGFNVPGKEHRKLAYMEGSTFEDKRIATTNAELFNNECSFSEWLILMKKVLKEHQTLARGPWELGWGFKDPLYADLASYFRLLWKDLGLEPYFIWCKRDAMQTIHSMRKQMGWPLEQCWDCYHNRHQELLLHLHGYDKDKILKLDFSTYRDREELRKELKSFVKRVGEPKQEESGQKPA